MRRRSEYRAWCAEKSSLIEDHLERFPPTIVVYRQEGLYIFAYTVSRVHNTIVLAGVGQHSQSIEDWFRQQIDELRLAWGENVPKAKVEGRKLLLPLFAPNLDASEDIIFAELMIAEIGKFPHLDYAAFINYKGEISEFAAGENKFFIVSHKQRISDDRNNETEEENKKNGGKAYRLAVRNELQSMGIDPDLFEQPYRFGELLEQLKRHYPGMGRYLSREKLNEGKYQWIYRKLF